MSKTRVELIARTLKILGKLRVGQSPEAEDSQSVDDEIDPLLANLNRRKVIYVPDPDDIDDEVFQPLARRLAAECADDFGVDIATMPLINPLNAESELRALAPATSDNDVIPFDDF